MNHQHDYDLIGETNNFDLTRIARENGLEIKPKIFYRFYCRKCLKFEVKVLEMKNE